MAKTNDFICPECKGVGGEYTILEDPQSTRILIPCFYCAGTGYASDDDEFQEFWRQ